MKKRKKERKEIETEKDSTTDCTLFAIALRIELHHTRNLYTICALHYNDDDFYI